MIGKLATAYRKYDNAQSTIYDLQDNSWGPPISGKKRWIRVTGIVWFIVGAFLILDDNPAGWGVIVLGLLYWIVVAISLFSQKKEIKVTLPRFSRRKEERIVDY
jgi:hypothetical protein